MLTMFDNKSTWCLLSTETRHSILGTGWRGGREYGGGGRGDIIPIAIPIATRMTPALRWAMMRAISTFRKLWGTKSQDSAHEPPLHFFLRGALRPQKPYSSPAVPIPGYRTRKPSDNLTSLALYHWATPVIHPHTPHPTPSVTWPSELPPPLCYSEVVYQWHGNKIPSAENMLSA